MTARITFLGAAGTVTGSKFFIEENGRNVLVDCGLFQGFKQLRQRNWNPLPFDPGSIENIVLTHAHIDHSGYLPILLKKNRSTRVICTNATRDLCAILLPDSGYLQEREAEYANKHNYSRHKPAKPLYTRKEAEAALPQFHSVDFDEIIELNQGQSVRFLPAGHILGAAIVEMNVDGKKIVFSGDLGRPNSATMVDPTPVQQADYLLVESTYGNRRHSTQDSEDALADIINRTVGRGGTIIIPSFAVGRTQTILYHLQQLKAANRIQDLPVFLDSPMAINASKLFCNYADVQKLTQKQTDLACGAAKYVRSVEESKSLDSNPMPKVIISASGMATGGRVVHHIKSYVSDVRNTILFTGFQAGGTRGEHMTHGAETVKIHGENWPIRAEVANLHMLSAHADADEIMSWLGNFQRPPKMTFIVHGEPAASDALQDRIEDELDWDYQVPEHLETVELT